MTGLQITPGELEQGGSHLVKLGARIGQHTEKAGATHQRLAAHVGADRSRLGAVFGKVLDKTGDVLAGEGKQLARVVTGSGTRITTTAHTTRETDVNAARLFQGSDGSPDRPRAESPTRPSSGDTGSATPRAYSTPGQHMPGLGNTTHPSSAQTPSLGGYHGNHYYTFRPSDVHSEPTYDPHDGRVFGVIFPTRPQDLAKAQVWASKNDRTSDRKYFRQHRDVFGTYLGYVSEHPAPWAGTPTRPATSTPFYAHAHATQDYFFVNANISPTGHPPFRQELAVDGQTYGEILRANRWYQQGAGQDPNKPLVLLSCDAGNPHGTAAGGVVGNLHGNGDNRWIYAAQGKPGINQGQNHSDVSMEDTSDPHGNLMVGGFRTYPPPMQVPPHWHQP